MLNKEEFADLRIDSTTRRRIGEVCPYLGLFDDPGTHALFVTDEHRCFANGPQDIALGQQAELCLTALHASCPIAQAAAANPAAQITQSSVARSPRSRPLATLMTVAVVLLVGLGALVAWKFLGDGSEGDAAALVTETATAELSAAVAMPPEAPADVLDAVTATATSTPAATATPTATLAPSPTATLAPTSAPAVSHVVAPGETLGGIARQYGLTAEQLAAANGISPGTVLYSGDSLVLPPPR
jgi:LysM repeat protein